MAATRLISLYINKGKTAAASIKDRIGYELAMRFTKGKQAYCI